MPVVVGVDPSLTATGVCRMAGLDGGVEGAVTTFNTEPKDSRPWRFIRQRERLRAFLEASRVGSSLLVAMESEVWTHRADQASDSAAIQALYQVLLYELREEWLRAGGPVLGYLPVNPSQVKKWLGAKGKDEVLLQVYKRYGREFRDHNQADAFTIAAIGQAYLLARDGGEDRWTQPQREVLDKLLSKPLPWTPIVEPETHVRARRRPRQ